MDSLLEKIKYQKQAERILKKIDYAKKYPLIFIILIKYCIFINFFYIKF